MGLDGLSACCVACEAGSSSLHRQILSGPVGFPDCEEPSQSLMVEDLVPARTRGSSLQP
jgi:hypothetical protein